MGMLFLPKVQLNRDEMILWGRVCEAWGKRDLGNRDSALTLVKETANYIPEQQREAMIEHVMTFIDELKTMALYANSEGNA